MEKDSPQAESMLVIASNNRIKDFFMAIAHIIESFAIKKCFHLQAFKHNAGVYQIASGSNCIA
jgi:hypothetical protein